MAKIIIEHVTKSHFKPKLYAFIDGKKVGHFRFRRSCEVDVPAGDHLLDVRFRAKAPEGVTVPFHVAEGTTKHIKTIPTKFALRMSRWFAFVATIWVAAQSFVATRLFSDEPLEPEIRLIFQMPLLVMLVFFLFIERKKNKIPKDLLEIEVVE